VIFVHGCFWHQHHCPHGSRCPKSNRDYWIPKFQRNRERDAEHQLRLNEMAWTTLVIWECELSDQVALRNRIRAFLESR